MKNRKNIALLLIANAVSQFAQGISMIAIPWFFINKLKEQSTYNTVFFVVTLATLFWAQYAGTLIDKYHRKSIFQGLCLVGLIILSFAGFSPYFSTIPLKTIAIGVFAFTVLNYNIHYPALYALAQELADSKVYGKVNSLLEIQGQATSMLSGAAAAVLIGGLHYQAFGIQIAIEAWSLNQIFLLDAFTYFLAFSLLIFLRSKDLNDFKRDVGSVSRRLRLGWAYLANNPLIFRYGLFSYFVFVTVIVHVFYIMHMYVSDHLHGNGTALAVSEVAHTLGALCAGIFIRKVSKNWTAVKTSVALMLLIIGVFILAALSQVLWLYAASCLVIGFANSGIRITRVTFLFSMIPKNTIGRATSVFQSANISLRLMLIALFHLPFFIENPDKAYWVYALFIAFALLPILSKYKAFVQMEQKSPALKS